MLKGKRGLIMGVANERSIAWGIAKAMAEAGAELAFTYQGEAFGSRLKPLAESVGSDCSKVTRGSIPALRTAWAIARDSSQPATPPPITAISGSMSPLVTAARKSRQRLA